MAKRKKRIPYQAAIKRANEQMYRETEQQVFRLYPAVALALWRYWGKRQLTIKRFLKVSHTAWNECAGDRMTSMVQICEQETGIEVQCGDGRSWKELIYLNPEIDVSPYDMTAEQWLAMRIRQTKWLRPQIMACLLVSLHRKYGFGYDRCGRVYAQMQEIEAEYGCDPIKLKQACIEITGIDVSVVILSEEVDDV